MATVLLYLTDDFDGGETAFPRLGGMKLKPPIGSAFVFYNFGNDELDRSGPAWGGRRCNLDTLHRSEPVRRGSKVVLQRWYTYREHPFLAARAMPSPRPPGTWRHPFQPVISCDYVQAEHVNVSCRWYNSDEAELGMYMTDVTRCRRSMPGDFTLYRYLAGGALGPIGGALASKLNELSNSPTLCAAGGKRRDALAIRSKAMRLVVRENRRRVV